MDSDTEEELWSWYKTVKKKDLRPQRCGWLQQLREEAKQKKMENSPFKENENGKFESNFMKVENININTPKNGQSNALRTPLREQMPSPGNGISPISNTMLTPTMILPRGTDVSSPHNISILSSAENAFLYTPEDNQPGNTTIDIAFSLGAALDDPSTQWTPGLATPAPLCNKATVTPTSDRSTKSTPSSVTNITNTPSSVSAMYTTPVGRNDRNDLQANSQLRQKVLARSLFSPNLNESRNSSSSGVEKLKELEKSSENDKLPLVFTSSAENLDKEIEEASKSFEEFGKYSQVFSLCGDNNIYKNNASNLVYKCEEKKETSSVSEKNQIEKIDRVQPNLQNKNVGINNKGANFNIPVGPDKDDVTEHIEHREYTPSSPSKKKRKLNTMESTQSQFQHSFSGIDSTNNNIAARIGKIDSINNHHLPPNPPLPKPHHTPLFKSKITEIINEENSPKNSNDNKPSKQNNSVNKILSKLSRQKNKRPCGRFLYPINKGGGYEELNLKYKDNLCDATNDLENKVDAKVENANEDLLLKPPDVSPQINRNKLSSIQKSFMPLSKLESTEKLKNNLNNHEISPEASTSIVIPECSTVISSKQTVSAEGLYVDLKSYKEKNDSKKMSNSRNLDNDDKGITDEFDSKIKDAQSFVVPNVKYNETKISNVGRITRKSMKNTNPEQKCNIQKSQQYHMNDTFNDAIFADMDLSFCLSGRASGSKISDQVNQAKETRVKVNKGFGGFTTGSGSKVMVSEAALQRAQKVLDEVDQEENGSKEMSIDNRPVPNKCTSLQGFMTGSGNKVTISEVAVQRSRKMFEEAEQTENENEELSKIGNALPSKCTGLQGFMTGSGNKVAISEAAVQRSRKMFEEAEQTENRNEEFSKIGNALPSKCTGLQGFMTGSGNKVAISEAAVQRSREMFEEAEQTENENIELSKIGNALPSKCTGLQGFMTGSGNKVTISEAAVKRSRKMFEETEQTENGNEELSKTEIALPSKCTSLQGFMTGSGSKVTMSDAALKRSRKMFEEPEQKENVKEQLSKIDDGFSKKCDGLTGFMTEIGKKITTSEVALQRSRKIFEEVEQKDNRNEIFSKNMDHLSRKSAALAGFMTGSGNKVTISENALQRSKKLFEEAEQKDNGKEELSKNNDSLSNKPAAFTGFRTGSGNKVSISEKALSSARKVLDEVDQEGTGNKILSIDKESESIKTTDFAGNTSNFDESAQKVFEEAEQKNNERLKLSIKDATLPNNHIGFPGFMTGRGNKVKVSEKAIVHARKVLEDIDKDDSGNNESTRNNETVSNTSAGFSGNKLIVSESNLLKVQKTFEPIGQNNESKEPLPNKLNIGFTTAGGSRVEISDAALVKAKKIWEDDSTDAIVPDLSKNKDTDYSKVLKGSNYNSNGNIENSSGNCNSKIVFNSAAHGFKTASGNNVNVNEASLNKAMLLCNEEYEQDKDLKVGEEILKEKSSIHIKTLPSDKLQTPVNTTKQFDSFQTAAGKKLHVNPASYQKGKKIMEEISQDQKMLNQDFLVGNTFKKQDKHIKNNSSKEIDIENEFKKSSNLFRGDDTFGKANLDLVGFKTAAGLGIKVNESALAKASNMWNDIEDKSINHFNIGPAANNSNLEENIEKVSNDIGFRTGKGKTIHVSEKANEKAQNLLTETSEELSNSNFPLLNVQDNYKKNLSDKADENPDQFSRVNTVKDFNRFNGTEITSSVLPGIGFTSANGSKFKLSDMAIEKAKKLMEDVQDLEKYSDSFTDDNFVSDDVLSKIDTTETRKDLPKLSTGNSMSNYKGFATGNGKLCKVSNSSLKKAQNILVDSNDTSHELSEDSNSEDYDDEGDFIGFVDNLRDRIPPMKDKKENEDLKLKKKPSKDVNTDIGKSDHGLLKREEFEMEVNNVDGLNVNKICNFNVNDNHLQPANIHAESNCISRTNNEEAEEEEPRTPSPVLGTQKFADRSSSPILGSQRIGTNKKEIPSIRSLIGNNSQSSVNSDNVSNRTEYHKKLSHAETDNSPVINISQRALKRAKVVKTRKRISLSRTSQTSKHGKIQDTNNSSMNEIEYGSGNKKDFCVGDKGLVDDCVGISEVKSNNNQASSIANETEDNGWSNLDDWNHETIINNSAFKENKDITIEEHSDKVEDYKKRKGQSNKEDHNEKGDQSVTCVKQRKGEGQSETQDISDITECFLFDESSSEPWENETISQGRKRSRGESEELSGTSKRSRNEMDQDISMLSEGNTSIVADKDPKDIREEILEERSMLKLKQSKTVKYKEKRRIAPIQGSLSKLRAEDKKSRIKLSTLGPLKRIKNCSSDVYSMTPEKAEKFRFPLKSEETSTLTCGDGCILVPGEDECVGVEEVECGFFAMAGVQPKLVPAGWVMNHYKWIVWSLSGTERRLGHKLGRILNINNVLLRLKYRYDREIDEAERPVLRKITEQDDIPQKSMILCVSNIITMKKSPNKPTDTHPKNMDMPPGVIIRLTDGWYSVCSSADSAMCQLIQDGIVRPGTKLYIHGAELGGVTSACHPLDAPPTLRLKLHANMVRRARWWSRLGVAALRGPLPSALAAIRADGGTVGKITVIIARMYPMQYMEKSTTGGRTIFRGEKAHNKYLNQKMQQSELEVHKIVAEVEKEFENSQRISRTKLGRGRLSRAEISKLNSGQELAKLLEEAGDPSSLQDLLSSDQMEIARRWQEQSGEQRQRKIHAEVQKRLSAKGKPYSFTPLCKLRVVDSGEDVAIITMWRPNEELLQCLSEGLAVNISYLQANGERQGTMALTASKTTHWEPLLGSAAPQNLPDVTRTTTALCQLSPGYNKAEFGEVDLVGVVFRVDLSGQIVYLVDHCGNTISIKVWGGVKECGYEEITKDGTILCIMNGSWRGHTGGRFCQVHVTELTVLSCAPRQEHLQEAQQHLKESIEDMHATLLEANSYLDKNYDQRTYQNKNEEAQKQNNGSSLVLSEDSVNIQGKSSANLSDAIASPSCDSLSKLRTRQSEVRNKMQSLQQFSSPTAAIPTLHSPISARLNKPFRAPLRNKGKNIT